MGLKTIMTKNLIGVSCQGCVHVSLKMDERFAINLIFLSYINILNIMKVGRWVFSIWKQKTNSKEDECIYRTRKFLPIFKKNYQNPPPSQPCLTFGKTHVGRKKKLERDL